MLLHSPVVADGWNSLLGTLRGGAGLPADLRELAVLRIAVLNDAGYEWDSHEADAAAAGLTAGQMAALRDDEVDISAFTPLQAAVLRLIDTMTRSVRVPDEVFADIAALLDAAALVELVVVVAAYNMVSRLVVALEVTAAGAAR
ncbi:carboxymuconolactone decarboxylase family protein [Dactylosporangium sp. CA-092794]|uniref:carboxymuconolactone decarboxylase family protein n=1 Tax=Dactylosporangium sp. CA-092794 TaxID=3239929 RepID=UPI003D9227D8